MPRLFRFAHCAAAAPQIKLSLPMPRLFLFAHCAAAAPQIKFSHPMPRFLRFAHCATTLLLRILILPPPFRCPFTSASFPSAFTHNLLRILHNEITYLLDYRPPTPPPPIFNSFSIDPRPGQQSIRLISQHGKENIKVDATMVDGAVPRRHRDGDLRLHISLVVEVSKGDAVLAFGCSAWQDCLEVQRVFHVVHGAAAVSPYLGRDFKKLDEEMQDAVYGYLEERGVDDELAGFLHEYVENKDNFEMIQWLGTVETYVQK